MKDVLAMLVTRYGVHSLRQLRKILVALAGFTVLLIGIALLVLPGPAVVVIPLGLAILATEFVWARRLLHKAKAFFAKATNGKPPPAPEEAKQDSAARD